MTTEFPAAVIYAVGTPPAIDGRVRFREIFCTLLAEEPDDQTFSGACESFLLRLNDDPLPGGPPRPLPNRSARLRVLIVPGFLNECLAAIAHPFGDAKKPLEKSGYVIEELGVGSRFSSDANAAFIAEAVESLNLDADEKLVMVGHSKGAVDILHFLVNYPQVSRRVAAVVSVAGAINGSRLAARLDDVYTDLARDFLPYPCDTRDSGALADLMPTVRLSWLAAHPLPASVRYFSVAAFTEFENISPPLKKGYDALWLYSPRNDGILLIADQIIPGATLLGYANADHLSVALPLENTNLTTSKATNPPGKFPRKVLLQAVLVYLAEALEPQRE